MNQYTLVLNSSEPQKINTKSQYTFIGLKDHDQVFSFKSV